MEHEDVEGLTVLPRKEAYKKKLTNCINGKRENRQSRRLSPITILCGFTTLQINLYML